MPTDLPPSPSDPDSPTALTVYTGRLAKCLSYSSSANKDVNRIVARVIVRDIFRRAVHLPQAQWTIDGLCAERSRDLLLLARRMRAAAKIATNPQDEYVYAAGAYQRNSWKPPLAPKEPQS